MIRPYTNSNINMRVGNDRNISTLIARSLASVCCDTEAPGTFTMLGVAT